MFRKLFFAFSLLLVMVLLVAVAVAQDTDEPTPTPLMRATATRIAEVRANQRINVRDGPGTNNAIIGQLVPGIIATVIGENEDSSWLNVILDNTEGWVFADLVRLIDLSVHIEQNDEWAPIVQEFDGVEMVLVPPGCFAMGSTDEQLDAAVAMCIAIGEDTVCERGSVFEAEDPPFAAEQPVTEICFDEPFWIDRSEVTPSQFTRLGGVAANATRGHRGFLTNVSWFEARDFCELRGGRLSSEAEWEYSARGPDALIYPYGNTFVSNMIYDASWVGALNMSGAVWEWTNTIFEPYPYQADDGREAATGLEARVIRNMSYYDWDYTKRAARRSSRNPSQPDPPDGFRCARDFEQ